MSTGRFLQFSLTGRPGALITTTEIGTGQLQFDVVVTDNATPSGETAYIADLRGVFLHVTQEALLDPTTLKVAGSYFSSSGALLGSVAPNEVLIGANAVTDLGGGVNINGEGVNAGYAPFDIGIEIGSQGIGQDDVQRAVFTLTDTTGALTLDTVADQYFGLRLTSVGMPNSGRDGSLKLFGISSKTPSSGTPPIDHPKAPSDPVDTTYEDLIEGGAGNDTIYGGRGNDEMQGEGGDDIISGGTDNGRVLSSQGLGLLIGDNLYGNDGRDIFLYKKGDGVDMIWDFQPGYDTIRLSGYTKASITKENVVFINQVNNRIGTTNHDKIAIILDKAGHDAIVFNDYPNPSLTDAAITFADGSTISSGELLEFAKSNAVAVGGTTTFSTIVQSDTLTGQNAYGSNGADTLLGGAGNDRLYGNEGSDLLAGRGGSDKLYGTGGADLIFGDEADELLIRTPQSFTLSEDALNLTAIGKGNISLTGNALNNIITGNKGKNVLNASAGDDKLNGKLGKDVMTGGEGMDAFVFDAKLGKSNVDRITDFTVRDDTILLENSVFKMLGRPGTLKKAFFTIGKKAADANDHVIYDKRTGALYYDADGYGEGAQIKFAQLAKKLQMKHKDFFVT